MAPQAKLARPATRRVHSRASLSSAWDDFPMRPDDIVISTYPKCGTTWTQRIVGMLVFGSAAPFPIQESSPWPDFRLPPPGAMRELAESQTHRRFLKSHLPFDALPFYEGVKYIHVARDGRDAAMSFFHHKSNYTPEVVARWIEISNEDPKFGDGDSFDFSPQDPVAHFADWVDGPEDERGDPGGGYFAMENSFWAARHEPNVLLVHFNDLKADLEGEMRRIADFLDIALPEDVWPEIVAAADFPAMRAASSQLMPTAAGVFKGGGQTFLNKGTNKRWQGVVRPEDLERYEAKVRAEFSPELAVWCEHGRLATRDPRDVI
ncbi:Glycolipid sulfotransferase [Tsuneonella dongtanensis]|uniref:Glycolipid sulfotransferase n=1 Tax=Tsuneonella dongtanensis TaxID=692370 RepID=A0A1B2AGI5_9SPHN|nr:sulfotransferase domain-containing protein [Tsuneonella dongtanensis]ANY21254.1 Glycolipid sulfotransferase [Tsuneonella dongtanensis]